MAAKKKAAKAGAGAVAAGKAAGSNPYVQRLVEDRELRENLRTAFESTRKAYGRMSNKKGPTKALMEDKKVQKDLRQAAESLREASEQLRGKRRKSRLGRLILIALLGAIIAVLVSEDIRKALLDRLFGAEEEFEYTSTTTPAPETAGTTT